MTYRYCLNKNEFCDLKVDITNKIESVPNVCYGYDTKLNKYKDLIDNIESDTWKKVRWYMNKYDFVVKLPIINRAFYKYWEILQTFNLFQNWNRCNIILHCAEAPGGFIQASNKVLFSKKAINNKNNNDTVDEDGFQTMTKKKQFIKKNIYTISLNKNIEKYKSLNLPSYNGSVIKKNVHITYGVDNSGDINNWENIKHILELSKEQFEIITCDGGLDEGFDFNHKEQLHYKLILSEIYTAIELQKINGSFILKMYDIYTTPSIHLIYLLTMCYNVVEIYKPTTSRPTNSEKYIVCKEFNLSDLQRNKVITQLFVLYNNMDFSINNITPFVLFDKLPGIFIESIKNINKEIINKQCEALQLAVSLVNSEFITIYKKNLGNILQKREKSYLEWTKKFNLY